MARCLRLRDAARGGHDDGGAGGGRTLSPACLSSGDGDGLGDSAGVQSGRTQRTQRECTVHSRYYVVGRCSR